MDGTVIGVGSLSTHPAHLREGVVDVTGSFALYTDIATFLAEGDGSTTVFAESSFTKFAVSGQDVSVIVGSDSVSGTMSFVGISDAVLAVTPSSGAAASLPAVKLMYGSAVLGSDAGLSVPTATGSSYITFDQAEPGKVRLTCVSQSAPLVNIMSGSVNLTDAVDPIYANAASVEAEFFAISSQEVSLKSGAITVPEGSTVWVGEKSITNTSGSVSVDSSGNITLGAQSHALIRDEFGGEYYLDNDGSEPMTQNVDQYVESHAFTGFNERREICISSVQEMYRTGQSQKVRALIDSTVEKLRSAVYDSSISYEENIRMLDHMVMGLEEQIRGMFDPEQAFQDYKESIIEELAALHIGETSLSEQRIIDNAITAVSNMQYSEQTYDDDMAAITEALAAVEKNLSGYRSSGSAAFIVLREILKDYVSTEPEDGFETITSLKQQYTSALEDIQYLNNLSSDAILQRLNDLKDAFDGAVYSIHSTEYQKVKNTVLAEMNALYQSYPSPTAGELIDSAIAKVNLRAYDAQRVYTDNWTIKIAGWITGIGGLAIFYIAQAEAEQLFIFTFAGIV
ncbi:MAG: hypothetical protein IIT52_02370, partial [Candidatus Methanomethylophilus sp.]|nr:hypothetical protein [Methanomethylophilus sp.]